jgi:hypothetical protein
MTAPDPTFRDFAGAVMRDDHTGAASVLETLLGLGAPEAAAATTHFRGQMANPAFMPKAMGLRAAVTSGSDAEIGALIEDCFGISGPARDAVVAAIRTRYPTPAP